MPDESDMLHYTPPPRLKLIGIIVGCVAIVVVVLGLLMRLASSHSVGKWTAANELPTVSVISLAQSSKSGDLVLPGSVQAFENAPIYARVSGYLKKWYVDIGSPVKTGQLMAVIDVPDQDQQYEQAKADLNTSVANQRLSATTAKRYDALGKLNAVSPETVDQMNGDLAAKTAAVASAKANLDRLAALENFKNITAPFNGIVTSRGTDIGQLIVTGDPSTPALFTVSDESKVRIYVNVPQDYSARIKPGATTSFTVPEYPGVTFTGTLIAAASAVNTQTGTMLMQIRANNTDHRLKAGDYAQVSFGVPVDTSAIRVPASVIIFNDSGTAVATLGTNNRVVVKPITILRDYGTSVEVAAGLSQRDRVIDNPPDSLRQGDAVRVAANTPAPATP
jgi:RND family efflux transporter MFP subunit